MKNSAREINRNSFTDSYCRGTVDVTASTIAVVVKTRLINIDNGTLLLHLKGLDLIPLLAALFFFFLFFKFFTSILLFFSVLSSHEGPGF